MKKFIDWILAFFNPVAPKQKPLKKVAICVGHSRLNDTGARSVGGANEWEYNNAVAMFLKEKLKELNIASEIFNEYPFQGYASSMEWVGEKTWAFDAVIELHFNSFVTSAAQGYEYLYHSSSANGKRLAEAFLNKHAELIPAQKNRGIKPVSKGNRGYKFLSQTKPPAIICEPFFGSCPVEWVLYERNQETLAELYSLALHDYFSA